MCVIIKRNPNVIIPEQKIVSACIVNSDGLGMSVVDRGKIETIKIHDSSKTPVQVAEDLMKRMEDAKEQQIYVHLRFTTAGKTNTENCHPFESLKDGDFEIQFMHNGTLNPFKSGEEFSDTWHFNNQILQPTLAAFYKMKGKDVLKDATLARILKEFKGYSVFTLYDSEGNDLILENNSCKQFDGWWASNEYSFDRYHRTGKDEDDRDPFGWRGQWSGHGYSPNGCSVNTQRNTQGVSVVSRTNVTTFPSSTKTTTQTPINNENKALKIQAQKTGYAIVQAKRNGMITAAHTPPTKRATFKELAGIDSLKDVMVLSEDELYDICNEKPVVATALLMDLIFELWKKDQEAKKAAVPAATNAVVANA